ncbi:hypothetical protein [Vulcaniibacterium tengchongense]|uniref:YD repeat-containing protein n=1 Tax=Vulcaniibacterium tengchongense TaxID=1273429 RepID=A0A3N4VQH0_9GAMM|nr:hypothetical protein [Vulcaniibacterium tengchongense]RPE81451.1 hypothetical protein EDC50_0641 [Vulcaniibacterium tengchongense]
MYRVEVSHQDGVRLAQSIAETAVEYGTAEAALAAVLPQAKRQAEDLGRGLWLRIYDERSRVVFGTLLP